MNCRMEEDQMPETVYCFHPTQKKFEKTRTELSNGETTSGSLDTSTSLADIFDTAFSSTVDPATQSRITPGNFFKNIFLNLFIHPNKT